MQCNVYETCGSGDAASSQNDYFGIFLLLCICVMIIAVTCATTGSLS